MNARSSKCIVSVVLIAALALAMVPLVGAQEEAGTARVRIGYFAFDPKDYDTYVDGEVFPFATQIINLGWSGRCFAIRCNTASPFFDFSDGLHSFAIVPHGQSLEMAILGPEEITLEAGHAYSLAIVGSLDAENLDLLVIDDTQIFAGTDPQTACVGILVNNIAGIPAFEMKLGADDYLVSYGQFADNLYPVGRSVHFTVSAVLGDEREHLFRMDGVPIPAGISDFGAMFGSYPGTYDRDYVYTANWGYPGQITALDGGTIELGSETTGEIATVTQRVRYTLTLAVDSVVNITASGTDLKYDDTILLGVTTFDPAVYLFDADGKLLVWNDDGSFEAFSAGKVEAKLEEITLKAGTYRIEVGGSNDLVSGPFELSVETTTNE